MIDDQRYLFCVYTASDSLKVGFDNKIDYFATVNNYLEYSGPVKTLPAGGSDQWYAAGFGFDVSPAITVNFDLNGVSVEETQDSQLMTPFPNPAVNLLSVPIRNNKSGTVLIEVVDLAGKLVLSETKTIVNGPLKINVASIPNGTYLFKMTFDDGVSDAFKVSVNR